MIGRKLKIGCGVGCLFLLLFPVVGIFIYWLTPTAERVDVEKADKLLSDSKMFMAKERISETEIFWEDSSITNSERKQILLHEFQLLLDKGKSVGWRLLFVPRSSDYTARIVRDGEPLVIGLDNYGTEFSLEKDKEYFWYSSRSVGLDQLTLLIGFAIAVLEYPEDETHRHYVQAYSDAPEYVDEADIESGRLAIAAMLVAEVESRTDLRLGGFWTHSKLSREKYAAMYAASGLETTTD